LVQRPSFTIGVEEEYLIVDPETRDLVRDLPAGLMKSVEDLLGQQVAPEFLRSQIEIGTVVSDTVQQARSDLVRLRRTVAEVAGEYGLAPIAASTHPFADWWHQEHTDKDRYNQLAEAMGGVVRRLLICGMHVHVCVEDEDLRIDLMNQALYFLPHLLALSTSSPFWHGLDTGLKSYRTSVFRSLPRTGMPDEFRGWADYRRHVAVLTEAGIVEDATKLWWDLRPSDRYPTLEMRASDICTSIDDAIAIAAIYTSLLSMLYRSRLANQRWRIYSRMLINENVWRAQRYGISDSLVDFARGELVPYPQLLEEIIELITPDAEELGCLDEVLHARTIVERGTSADRQLAIFKKATAEGADEEEALRLVVDFLIEETVANLD
jgi:carboxylate-amine ligase